MDIAILICCAVMIVLLLVLLMRQSEGGSVDTSALEQQMALLRENIDSMNRQMIDQASRQAESSARQAATLERNLRNEMSAFRQETNGQLTAINGENAKDSRPEIQRVLRDRDHSGDHPR